MGFVGFVGMQSVLAKTLVSFSNRHGSIVLIRGKKPL